MPLTLSPFSAAVRLSFYVERESTSLTCSLTARLLSRDPRMVERKKTGLAKARKAVRTTVTSVRIYHLTGLFLQYAWVKR